MSERKQEHEVVIRASAEDVWKALTDPDELARWYVQRAEVEPGVPGRLVLDWGQGVAVETRHLVWKPGEKLVVGKPEEERESGWDQILQEFTIETRGGGEVVLRMVQTGIPEGPDWDGVFDGTEVGWTMFFDALRFYLERHNGTPRRSVFTYQSLPYSREETWRRLIGSDLLGITDDPTSLSPGDEYRGQAVTGDELAGAVRLVRPGRNFTATVGAWNDGLISFDASGTGDSSFVNLVVATFGFDDAAQAELEDRWTKAFGEVFGATAES